jgi:hypothetical protein
MTKQTSLMTTVTPTKTTKTTNTFYLHSIMPRNNYECESLFGARPIPLPSKGGDTLLSLVLATLVLIAATSLLRFATIGRHLNQSCIFSSVACKDLLLINGTPISSLGARGCHPAGRSGPTRRVGRTCKLECTMARLLTGYSNGMGGFGETTGHENESDGR